MEFVPFQKIPRWSSQDIIISEKIDGTNACIWISDDCTEYRCGSRTRWITPTDDNYGFAGWVERNKDAILGLGKGTHFGEWWGLGIQRCYNEQHKRFSLFNTLRWNTEEQQERLKHIPNTDSVPILYQGPFSDEAIESVMARLWSEGSSAAPGFRNPEGIVIYMPGSRTLFKKTFGDNLSKYLAA